MSKLLLLVHSEADVAHLDAAAQAILRSAITGIWCVFSPAITVNASEAASKLDGEIEQLRTAERQAAERSDYTAAAGYKTQREGKELDRAKALRDAWKTAPEEDRKKKTQSIFSPFIAQLKPNGLNVRITGHSDHYDREQWVAMLNSLSGVWFKEFAPGSFVVAWPESVATAVRSAAADAQARLGPTSLDAAAAAKVPAVAPAAPQTRREELQATRTFGLVAAAKKVGVDTKGKSKPVIIDEILAAEAGATAAAGAPAPEPVEAY